MSAKIVLGVVVSLLLITGGGCTEKKDLKGSENINKAFFEPNKSIPSKISDGKVVLGTLYSPKKSFEASVEFKNGKIQGSQSRRIEIPKKYQKVNLTGNTDIAISVAGKDRDGRTMRMRISCDFDCYFEPYADCMICGWACRIGDTWWFGMPQCVGEECGNVCG